MKTQLSELFTVDRAAPYRFDFTVRLLDGSIYAFGQRKGKRPTKADAIVILENGLNAHIRANAKNPEAIAHRALLTETVAAFWELSK
jgi:hypothetical protein